ncbi:MAG TPA: HIT domain-containing protein [Euzebya sp.]|nr:HIT domain-containing protein [Euzebya sp.]
MADDCLFCRIASGEEPSDRVAADEGVIAIRDKFPQAPVHVLVLPVAHVDSVHALTDDDLLARCVRLARQVAEEEGIAEGYRLATNVGRGGGQAIAHLHFHVIGGRQLGHIDDAG